MLFQNSIKYLFAQIPDSVLKFETMLLYNVHVLLLENTYMMVETVVSTENCNENNANIHCTSSDILSTT
jgi:hypothetical protein